MEKIKSVIIDQIRRNKISTTEVADVLGKTGHIPGPLPLIEGQHKVGEVEFVYAWNKSNWEVHEQLAEIEEEKFIYVHGIDCENRAIFGDLVSKYIMLYKNAVGIVVNGLMRDAHTLIKEKYPIWCTGVSPIGCTNTKNETSPDPKILDKLRNRFQDAIFVADDSGVVIIEKDQINQKLIDGLEHIELQEDIWFFCMDTHKMNTYEIVCEKRYLKEKGLISNERLKKLANLKS